MISHCVQCKQYLEIPSRPEIDPVMIHAVSRRPRTLEARARSLPGPREIRSGETDTDIRFFPGTRGFYCQYRTTSNPY